MKRPVALAIWLVSAAIPVLSQSPATQAPQGEAGGQSSVNDTYISRPSR